MATNVKKIVDLIVRGDADQAKKELSGLDRSMNTLKKTAVALGGAIALGKLASDFVQINREYQRLNASLITVTGSAEAAESSFAEIEEFAKETPYQLNQVVEAFVKLKAMGLDPSMEALTSYGNTASAMGKDLNQMIEAVADAATGEFERLKEFGIKARSQGDKVTFTFRGVSKTVKKEAAAIEGYLRDLGDVEFAGGMVLQMDTLGGAISNLQDAYDGLFRNIGEDSGLADQLTESIKKLSGAISDPAFQGALVTAAELIAKIGKASVGAVSDLNEMGRAIAIARAGYGDWLDVLLIPFSDSATENIINQFDALTVQQRSVSEAISRTKDEIEDLTRTYGFVSKTDKERMAYLKGGLAYLEQQKIIIDALASAQSVPADSWFARDIGAPSQIETKPKVLGGSGPSKSDKKDLSGFNFYGAGFWEGPAQAQADAQNKSLQAQIEFDEQRFSTAITAGEQMTDIWLSQADDQEAVMERHNDAMMSGADELSQFTIQAYRNMTDASADFFYDALDGNLKSFEDYASSFGDMVNRMVANYLAQMAMMNVFGIDSSGASTGGGLFGWVGGMFGGERALGGPVSAHTPYLVGERGPELFVPNASGNITPNNQLGGPTMITVPVTINGDRGRDFEVGLRAEIENVVDKYVRSHS